MRREDRRFFSERLQVLQLVIAHGDECIYSAYKVISELLIARAALVRNDIIYNADHARFTILLCPAQYGAKRRAHKGQPVFYYYQIVLLAVHVGTNAQPVERVDGIDHAQYPQPLGCRPIGVLCFAGEQDRRVLQGERPYSNIVALSLQFVSQALIECCQAAPKRMRCAQNGYLHGNMVLKSPCTFS